MIRRLRSRFRDWDRPSQVGFASAIVLLIPALIVARTGPESLRGPATVGVIGLVIAAQVVFMWANRGMVTDFTRAQRHYLRGEFEQAVRILEHQHDQGKADFRSLTLLGNTYRQLGRLDASESVLLEALDINPQHYFSLYGFGRTLLVMGRYTEAAQMIERALQNGGAPGLAVDAAEAYYYGGGAGDKVVALLRDVSVEDEPHRALMAAHLLHRHGAGERPAAMLVRAGLPYWQQQAALFRSTPYGVALAYEMDTLAKET